ncbi:hypothetical protein FACS1894125_4780 [Actinomycetota bacterium]|nr:hypothetical protein FACS1894125_4780 [Actinomycetota bacterium]
MSNTYTENSKSENGIEEVTTAVNGQPNIPLKEYIVDGKSFTISDLISALNKQKPYGYEDIDEVIFFKKYSFGITKKQRAEKEKYQDVINNGLVPRKVKYNHPNILEKVKYIFHSKFLTTQFLLSATSLLVANIIALTISFNAIASSYFGSIIQGIIAGLFYGTLFWFFAPKFFEWLSNIIGVDLWDFAFGKEKWLFNRLKVCPVCDNFKVLSKNIYKNDSSEKLVNEETEIKRDGVSTGETFSSVAVYRTNSKAWNYICSSCGWTSDRFYSYSRYKK